MAASLIPTTELQAVNKILASITSGPVNSLSSGDEDAEQAETKLHESSRTVQSKGWHWNTECNFEFFRDENNKIKIPKEVMRLTPDGDYFDRHLVVRGFQLYDASAHSFDFTDDSKITATIVSLLDFSKVPEPFRWWIVLHASLEFLKDNEGSAEIIQVIERQLQRAEIDAKKYDARIRNANIKWKNVHHRRILNRRTNSGSARWIRT